MLPGVGSDWMNAEVSTGTTILAFKYSDGVVIAADSRTSTGFYVSNRITDKLTKITDFVYCCRSGSAADTQAIADLVAYNTYVYENQNDKPATVHDVAHEFRHICYENRSQLLAGIIVAGFNECENKGQIFSIALGGMLWEEEYSIGGSGSSYVHGYVESNYKPNMKLQESLNFASGVVGNAMTFDGHSGGVIRLATITKHGIKRFNLKQTLKDEDHICKPIIEIIY